MKYKKLFIILGTLVVLAVIALGAYWLTSTKPTGATEKIVESTGSTSQFAVELARKGIIRSPFMFKSLWGKNEAAPEEGYYSLAGTSLEDIIATVKKGPNVVKVTFPEGFSSGQVSQRLGNRGYDASAIYELAQPNEGKLFPETYFFLKGASPQDIIDKMMAQYDAQVEGLGVSEEDLIIASIVEREAKKDDERPKIAAVYKNRLAIGMDLESDPTVQYGRDLSLIKTKGLTDVQLWEPLSAGQVRTISSAYNTYINGGLPPGPICNPSIKSIKAAVNPEQNFDALFFFHDEDGNIHFSNSFEQHQSAIAQYGVSGR